MDSQEQARVAGKLRRGNRVFLWLMLLGLPLALHHGYFDITQTKTVVFVICASAYLCFWLVMALQYRLPWGKPDGAEWAAFALALAALFSSLMSGFFRDSFLGLQGRYQGAGMLLLYALLFATIRRRDWPEAELRGPLLAGFCLTAALAVGNHLGADPLRLMGQLIPFDRGRYISTLGNINFAGAYFTLLWPAAAVWTLSAEKGGERLLLAAVSLLGLWAVMACRSESSLLGLGAVIALLPLLLRHRPAALRRWPWLLSGIALGMQLYRLVCAAGDAYLSALTRLLLHPAVSLALLLAGLLLGLTLRKMEPGALARFVKLYGAILLALLGAGVALLVLLNTLWRELPLGALGEWLRFSDSWGTDRGMIWARCLGYYRDYSPMEKLLGGGCGILPRLDVRAPLFSDAVLDTAHCEYLQILLNWGALGLAAWLGWLGLVTVRAFRREGSDPALLAGTLAYAVQALVNIAQAPSVCLFVLLLSLTAAGERQPAKD